VEFDSALEARVNQLRWFFLTLSEEYKMIVLRGTYYTLLQAMKLSHTLRLLLDAFEMHSFDRTGLRRALRNRRAALSTENRAWWTRSASKLVCFALGSRRRIRELSESLIREGGAA
jgi:hypothetical protein